MKRLLLLVLTAVLLCGCTPTQPQAPEAVGECTLTFLTIGKGDAFLLTTPEQTHYLVDTGKAQDYPQIARLLRQKGVDHLEGIFLSHGHKDHAGCLEALMKAFPTDRVYISARDTVSYTEILPREIVPAQGGELVELTGGEVLNLEGVTAEIWIPNTVDPQNANNNSVVMRLTHGDCSFLMMGDAELEEEAALMASDFPLQADVLKLGHHGEDDATSPAFLDRVKPSIGLITGNEAENPESIEPKITAALTQRSVKAYYSEGDSLDLCSDGRSLTVTAVPDAPLPQTLNLSFAQVDRAEQAVTLQNDSDTPAALEGCTLISQRGDEIYHFPADAVLDAGETLTVVCQDSAKPGDLIWTQDSVWKKQGDTALLYDKNMNLLAVDEAER